MKKHLLLSLLMLIPAFGTTWAQPSLNGCRHITDLSQIKEGAYYYIVSDRTKFNGTENQIKAMSSYQNYTTWQWSHDFVFWGTLQMSNDGFVWKAEKAGNQWAFQNAENSKYLGHKNTGETDMKFSDTAVGFTLTNLGSGQFSFTNSEYTEPLNVHNYPSFDERSVCATEPYSDARATDAAKFGYPGRWHLYELTGASALEDGETYYIIADRKKYAGNHSDAPKALSVEMDFYTTKWDAAYHHEFVYWGDFHPEYDGYSFVAEKNGYKWKFKNTKNNKYIGSELTSDNEPYFLDEPGYYILTDLTPDANNFFVQLSGKNEGMCVQGYGRSDREDSGICLSTDDGNETDGHTARWHFVKVSDYAQQIATDNVGTNTVTKIYAATGGENIIKSDGTCESLVLTEGNPFTAPENFTATIATYNRSMSNSWGTICLPYEVSSNSDVTYYTAGSINGDVLTLTSAETVPAGTPAIFKVNGGTFTATSNNVEVLTGAQNESITDDDIVLHGTLEKLVFDDVTTDTENDYYYISNNKFMHATRKLTVNPFRAYFTMTKSSSAPSNGFNIAVDDDSMTAIEALTGEGDTTITAIYTTDGKQLSDLQQGLNIVKLSNGKVQKIMVK